MLSIGRGSRQFPAPGQRLPIPRASWVPTIWPACEIGGGGLVTQSPALVGGGVSPSAWPCVYWPGLSCSVWRSSSPVAPSRVGCLQRASDIDATVLQSDAILRLPQPLFHLAARGYGHPKPSRNPRLRRYLSCQLLIGDDNIRSPTTARAAASPGQYGPGVRKGPISVVSSPSRCLRR
jgi:hypothetical protein